MTHGQQAHLQTAEGYELTTERLFAEAERWHREHDPAPYEAPEMPPWMSQDCSRWGFHEGCRVNFGGATYHHVCQCECHS